ncbi:protein JINGUBANG-like [Senna tora]|uniref:Protein JINGUBANG-like n=1 Tax=Senna tora TaxID=362788 RepID=A0A834W522_9FABA|nr:protein JINGUBANG-like [Senna tora]
MKSLSSQRSLASIPSLNSQSHHHHHPPNHPSTTTYHQCLTTLKGPTSSYTSSLALSGTFLYTGSSDREIRSWDRTLLTSHSELHPPHQVALSGKGAVKSIVVQSDHHKLFSAHQDHKIRVWKKTSNHQNKYTCVATLPTLGDRASKILSPKNQVQIRRHKRCTWVHHVDTVSALALSKDHTLLYSVSWDRTLKIWRTTDFSCLESVSNAHDDAINAVAVSNDGSVYTGSADKRIKVWKKGEGGEKKHALVDCLEKHKSGINALALSNDGCVLYSGACDSGSADKTIRIWRGVEREYCCLAVLEGHRGAVKCITATVDRCDSSEACCCVVYSGSLDCDIRMWQIVVPVV